MAKNQRIARRIEPDTLRARLAIEDGEIEIYEVLDRNQKLAKDIQKIEFDLENHFTDPNDWEDGDNTLIGFHIINDLTFCGVVAGGDWEQPIFFIIYLDPKGALRGYIPESGNVFNAKSKSAYGNDDDLDEIELKRLGVSSAEDLDFDWNLIQEDILNRIAVEQ